MNTWNLRAMLVACGTSAALTVALFWSFATGPLAVAFAAIALVVEWTRFAALDRAVTLMKKPIERWNFALWFALTLISVLASIATINKGAILAEQMAPEHAVLLAQIDNLQTTINQNNRFIDRYGDLDQLKSDAIPIQRQNLDLINQLSSLQGQLGALPAPEPNELQALAVGVTALTGGEPDQVLWWLVVSFSVALEVVAAWLVWVHAVSPPAKEQAPAPEAKPEPVAPETVKSDLYSQIRKAVIEDRSIPPVQRRIASELKVGASRVKDVLLRLESEGALTRNGKGLFEHPEAQDTSQSAA